MVDQLAGQRQAIAAGRFRSQTRRRYAEAGASEARCADDGAVEGGRNARNRDISPPDALIAISRQQVSGPLIFSVDEQLVDALDAVHWLGLAPPARKVLANLLWG